LADSLSPKPIGLSSNQQTAHNAKVKDYNTRVSVLDKDRVQVYEIIKGQFTDRLLHKMEKDPDWKSVQSSQQPLGLYQLIEKLTLSHTDDTYPYLLGSIPFFLS
jgi:hypothetical protein